LTIWGAHADPRFTASQRPNNSDYRLLVEYPGTRWDRYLIRTGNVIWIMLADRNEFDTLAEKRGDTTGTYQAGRGSAAGMPRGGYPSGSVTLDTFEWWKGVVENPVFANDILITTHHLLPRNTTITTDDGEHWKAIHSGLPRYGFTRVTPSKHDSDKVFVTLTGMGDDDFSAYVFKSIDRGKTWTSISQGLPLETVHVIREDPHVEGLLYVGTDLGVYTSPNEGETWHSLSSNLPTASVQDLFLHPRENELVAGTHGLSVFILDVSSLQGKPSP